MTLPIDPSVASAASEWAIPSIGDASSEGAGANNFGNQLASAMQRSGQNPGGVQVRAVTEDTTPNRRVYEPGHPDADAQGYVERPNVDSVTEMVDLISASRSYEANVTAMQAANQMFTKTLELLR